MKYKMAVITFFSMFSQALACRDPLLETHTFFTKLTANLSSRSVVAKITVISTDIVMGQDRVTIGKVVSALKGVKPGAKIRILSDTSSCNRDPAILVGRDYYVAGAIDTQGTFRGTWRQREIVELK